MDRNQEDNVRSMNIGAGDAHPAKAALDGATSVIALADISVSSP